MRDAFRNALAMVRSGRLFLFQFLGNAALFTAAALWLLIGEAHLVQLIFAVIAALAIVFFFVWLHTGTFEFAANPVPENFRPSFRPSPLRMMWLLVGFAILLGLMWYVASFKEMEGQIGGYLYAKAPHVLRPVSGESTYIRWVDYFLGFVFWYLLPAIFLPLIGARVMGSRIRAVLRTWKRWQYWVMTAIAVIVGVAAPLALIGWTPGRTLGGQTTSLILRLLIAYALFLLSWMFAVGTAAHFIRFNSAD